MAIYIALGANLESSAGPPEKTLAAVFRLLPEYGIQLLKRASFYKNPAFPPSDQPDFINSAALIETDHCPDDLLNILFDIERKFGRIRKEKWEARTLDLDLLDYDGQILDGSQGTSGLILPHPRLSDRAFVLKPLAEIAPDWVHPLTGIKISELLQTCIGSDSVVKLTPDEG